MIYRNCFRAVLTRANTKSMANKVDEDKEVNSIEKVTYLSPLGNLDLYGNEHGVTQLKFSDVQTDDHDETEAQCTTGDQNSLEDSLASTCNIHLQTGLKWIDQYFKDPSKLDKVEKPVLNMKSYNSKSFLVKAWQVLRKASKVGEMITYGQLAALAGNSKAGQSVGQAMRRNPFPIIVPCHRVIKADAKIGNYSWLKGVVTKKWLLDHEKKFISRSKEES